MPDLKNSQGLTLVEVMIAMTILVFALGGLLVVFQMNQKTVVYANNQQWAMNQARAKMETLLSYSYDDAQLSNGTHVVSGGCSYSITQTNNLKTIAVTISWTNPLPSRVASYVLITKMAQAIHQ